MAYSRKHAVNEASYAFERGGRYFVGQLARMGMRALTIMGSAIAGISGSGGAFYLTGLLGVGTGVGLHAYLNHKDYEHSKQELASMYSKELSSILNKDQSKVTVQDIEMIADSNPSIKEHLDKQRVKRNVKTGIRLAAAAVGFVAAAALFTAIAPAVAVGTSLVSVKILAGLGAFAAFQLSRPVIEPVAERAFSINEPTTVDIIKSLEWQMTKGQKISRAQVMGAYVSANPELDDLVQGKFNKSFIKLSAADQERVMLGFGGDINLDAITQAINENRMNAREITFAVHGQKSGAYVDPSYRQQWNDGVAVAKGKAKDIQSTVKSAGSRALNSVTRFVGKKSDDNLVSDDVSTKWRDGVKAEREYEQIGSSQTHR